MKIIKTSPNQKLLKIGVKILPPQSDTFYALKSTDRKLRAKYKEHTPLTKN